MLEGDGKRHQTAIVMEFPSREAAYGRMGTYRRMVCHRQL
jgi:uncharacterized protein (DUF1330 family)